MPTESDVLPTQDRERATNRNLDDPGTISPERGTQDRPTLMKPPKNNSKDTFEPR
ncbi:hypothetical protein LEP1GSC170_1285 [Leptospira interrogans serovar Bataviae str. HAI135]|nr:hypothetical protein LEP1GSC170_1285 [Leptospira interrogans serovar Bataviae str. HAI135]